MLLDGLPASLLFGPPLSGTLDVCAHPNARDPAGHASSSLSFVVVSSRCSDSGFGGEPHVPCFSVSRNKVCFVRRTIHTVSLVYPACRVLVSTLPARAPRSGSVFLPAPAADVTVWSRPGPRHSRVWKPLLSSPAPVGSPWLVRSTSLLPLSITCFHQAEESSSERSFPWSPYVLYPLFLASTCLTPLKAASRSPP